MLESLYYVDTQGREIAYFKGWNDMTVLFNNNLYHHENGFMLMAII